MGIRTEEKVFKKICELNGWKFQKYNNIFYLLTDIEAPRYDEDYPVYVFIEFLTKNCWRVKIPNLNYSYFKCKTLDEVYDLCKWYAEMPNMPTYKF